MADIRVNQAGLKALERSPAVCDYVTDQAERVAAAARASAPVLTGAYRDSIHLEQADDRVQVVAGTDHGIYVEAETGNMARALGALQ